MNAKTQKKPTGKVAEKITAAVKNIAKRLTAGKTAEKKDPVKKTEAGKKSKPDKPKPTGKQAMPTPKKSPSPKPITSKSSKAAEKPSKPAPAKTSAPMKKTPPVKPIPQKSPIFCVHDNRVNQFVPVKGAKAISIPGFDGIQLFLHKGTNDYRISEASSGGLVATGNKQAVAVRMATDTLNNHGKPKVLESIQKSIERMGVVPGFTPPEGVKAPPAKKEEPKEVFKVTTDDGAEVEVTYTPGFMKHLEFRGEISSTGYHSSFDYAGKTDVKEAARKKANELRTVFLKEQARLARKAKKDAPQSPQVTTRLKSQILAALVDGQMLPKPQVHLDEIAKSTGAESGDVAATLMVLELGGKVKSLPGSCYRLPTAEEQSAAKPAKTADGASSSDNRGGKPRGKMSLLDAAAEVLKDSKEPLCCKDITRLVFQKKLAESGGLTPHATLSAAMGREIAARGKDSRFKRADRGLFAFNS